MALIGIGVIPMHKDPEKNKENQQKFGWIVLVSALAVGIMGVFKLFGYMR